MKANKILSSALLALLLLSSCATDDLTPATAPAAGKGNIHFTLGGSAKSAASRADGTTAATAGETQINSLYAVLFDTHDGYYKTVQATDLGGGEYDILVEKDATYDVYFVANPSDELVQKLEAIDPEVKYDQAVKTLREIVVDQAPDADGNFLMVGQYQGRVTTTITTTEDLGEVTIYRRSSRFDIVNKAEGVTVTKISFNNRSVKTTVGNTSYNPDVEGYLSTEPKEYIPEGLVGSKETPTEYRHEIYSYPNLSMHTDSLPTIDIEYVETVDGKEVKKTHTVNFYDPNSPAGTPLVIKRNTLYTITLSKAYKLEFNLTVADWEEGEVFNQKQLPIELPEDKQDELNRNLLVYDLFAEYGVKTLNLADKTVEFFDEYLPASDYPEASYISYATLDENGINKSDAILTDAEGNKYRMPTAGELTLLVPFAYTEQDIEGADENGLWHVPVYITSRTNYADEFEETLYMKNDENCYILKNEDEGNVLKGQSQLRRGSVYTQTYIKDGDLYCNADDEGAKMSYMYSCYGLRFKGTDQYAAYKWEPAVVVDNDVTKRYFSIKIKALPKDSEISIYDITDNQTFWRNGYIEVRLPISGSITSQNVRNSRISALTFSSSKATANRSYYLGSNTLSRIFYKSVTNRYIPKLVKVKDTPAE